MNKSSNLPSVVKVDSVEIFVSQCSGLASSQSHAFSSHAPPDRPTRILINKSLTVRRGEKSYEPFLLGTVHGRVIFFASTLLSSTLGTSYEYSGKGSSWSVHLVAYATRRLFYRRFPRAHTSSLPKGLADETLLCLLNYTHTIVILDNDRNDPTAVHSGRIFSFPIIHVFFFLYHSSTSILRSMDLECHCPRDSSHCRAFALKVWNFRSILNYEKRTRSKSNRSRFVPRGINFISRPMDHKKIIKK